MPARPKQQHYVTRAYLEGFVEPGSDFLFCYGRKRTQAFRSQPSEVARQRNYYSFREPHGRWNDTLEHLIQAQVETPGLEVVRRLAGGDRRLNWSQRTDLAMFMALQRFRVPHLRQMQDATHATFVQQLLDEHKRMEKERGPGRLWIRSISPFRPDDPNPPRAYVSREELEEMQRSLQTDPGWFSRQNLLDMAGAFARVFARMKWTVHNSTGDRPFITSDCPVLLWHERREDETAGIIRPDSHIEFPLSRTSLLSMAHDFALLERMKGLRPGSEMRRLLKSIPEVRVSEASESDVRDFNLRQAQYCSQWAFTGRENDWVIDVLREESRNVRQRIVREGDFFRLDALTGGQ